MTKTYIFNGTWSDTTSTDVVATLHHKLKDYRIYSGPGTTADGGHPGNQARFTEEDVDLLRGESPGAADAIMVPLGTLFGFGTGPNSKDAFAHFMEDVANGTRSFCMVGWSRGAYTAFLLMRIIEQRFAEGNGFVKLPNGTSIARRDVNICSYLFDPVAMVPSNFLWGKTHIPGFDKLKIVYAGKETKRFLPPVILNQKGSYPTKYYIAELPGTHREIVSRCKRVGQYLELDFHKFLKENGVDTSLVVNDAQIESAALNLIEEDHGTPFNQSRLKELAITDANVAAYPLDASLFGVFQNKRPELMGMLFQSQLRLESKDRSYEDMKRFQDELRRVPRFTCAFAKLFARMHQYVNATEGSTRIAIPQNEVISSHRGVMHFHAPNKFVNKLVNVAKMLK